MMDENSQGYNEVSEQLDYERRFKQLANAIHSATSPNEIMVGLRDQILDVYEVEMASIFLVDAVKMQLFSWILLPGDFLSKIRVPVNKTSIVGYSAAMREVVLINNAYDREELSLIDPELKFDFSWDRKTGSRTRQILTAPIMFQRSLMGVIQLMNPRDGDDFTESDGKHISDLAETLGIAFRNLQQLSQRVPTKYDMLVKNELISDKELDRAFAIANQHNDDLENILIHNLRIPKEDLGNAMAQFYETHFVDLSQVSDDLEHFCEGLSVDYLRKARLVPLQFEEGKVVLAAEDPHDHASIYEVQQLYGDDFNRQVNISYSDSLLLYKPQGCDKCNSSGYKGRAGLYELLIKNDELNKLIAERASVEQIKKAAVANGMTTLLQEGIQMVFASRTDFNQVMSVCMS